MAATVVDHKTDASEIKKRKKAAKQAAAAVAEEEQEYDAAQSKRRRGLSVDHRYGSEAVKEEGSEMGSQAAHVREREGMP